MNNQQNPMPSLKDHRITAGLTLLALLAFSGVTNAAALSILSTTGTWLDYDYDKTTAQYAPSYVQGVTTNSLYWGYSTTGQKESLIFQGNGTPGSTYTPFAVGALSHANNGIYGSTNITSANLNLHLSLTNSQSFDVTYKFDIFQSGSNADPHLAYRDTLGFSPLSSTQFSFGGQTYAFTLNGFLDPSNNTINTNIIYEDGQSKENVKLYATISTVAPVPAPAALWLLGSGLIGLAGFAKRKHTPQ